MQLFKHVTVFIVLICITLKLTAQTKTVDHFDKIIVSPYIQVTLVQGSKESVTVNDIQVATDKLHIEVNDKTLRIYLEGAKDIPKNKKDKYNGYKESHPLYKNTSVTATITYTILSGLSIRGEEEQLCQSAINSDEFRLSIYGESIVTFNQLNLKKLHATLYGEGVLEIKAGIIKEQRYICYGEGKINSLATTGNSSRIIAYGEADFKINVADKINITAYGDAQLHYKGNPEVVKGLHFGQLTVDKMD